MKRYPCLHQIQVKKTNKKTDARYFIKKKKWDINNFRKMKNEISPATQQIDDVIRVPIKASCEF